MLHFLARRLVQVALQTADEGSEHQKQRRLHQQHTTGEGIGVVWDGKIPPPMVQLKQMRHDVGARNIACGFEVSFAESHAYLLASTWNQGSQGHHHTKEFPTFREKHMSWMSSDSGSNKGGPCFRVIGSCSNHWTIPESKQSLQMPTGTGSAFIPNQPLAVIGVDKMLDNSNLRAQKASLCFVFPETVTACLPAKKCV